MILKPIPPIQLEFYFRELCLTGRLLYKLKKAEMGNTKIGCKIQQIQIFYYQGEPFIFI
jgi:hypothetical protein